jgi:predicted hydrolase (HD superfamily)
MLTRFELFVILRNQVADRRHVRRALAVEATMEELARRLGHDPTVWAMIGLGAFIDAELADRNQRRRGEVAAEILRTEGAPAMCAEAAAVRVSGDPVTMPLEAVALAAAEAFVAEVYGALEAGDRFDSVEPAALAHRLRRAAHKRDDEDAQRALGLCARLGLDADQIAGLVVDGMRRVREDLRL